MLFYILFVLISFSTLVKQYEKTIPKILSLAIRKNVCYPVYVQKI